VLCLRQAPLTRPTLVPYELPDASQRTIVLIRAVQKLSFPISPGKIPRPFMRLCSWSAASIVVQRYPSPGADRLALRPRQAVAMGRHTGLAIRASSSVASCHTCLRLVFSLAWKCGGGRWAGRDNELRFGNPRCFPPSLSQDDPPDPVAWLRDIVPGMSACPEGLTKAWNGGAE
jgi:hypothetical protein